MNYKFIPVDNNLDKAMAFANSLDNKYITNVQKIKQKEFYIPTLEVVQKMQNQGWLINGVDEKRNKKSRKITNNYIQMTHPDFSIKNSKGQDEAYSSLSISNSCSGNQPLHMGLGAFRMVCSNGLISFDQHSESEKIKHTQINALNLNEFINSINSKAQNLIHQLNEWKNKDMTVEEIRNLAYDSLKLRLNEDDDDFNPEELLRVNRIEDEGNDVWTVFNRIQENLTHDIRSKEEDTRLNQQLFELVNREMAYA